MVVKNSNWWETDQMAALHVQLRGRIQIWTGLEFGTTGLQVSCPNNSTTLLSSPSYWLCWDSFFQVILRDRQGGGGGKGFTPPHVRVVSKSQKPRWFSAVDSNTLQYTMGARCSTLLFVRALQWFKAINSPGLEFTFDATWMRRLNWVFKNSQLGLRFEGKLYIVTSFE